MEETTYNVMYLQSFKPKLTILANHVNEKEADLVIADLKRQVSMIEGNEYQYTTADLSNDVKLYVLTIGGEVSYTVYKIKE